MNAREDLPWSSRDKISSNQNLTMKGVIIMMRTLNDCRRIDIISGQVIIDGMRLNISIYDLIRVNAEDGGTFAVTVTCEDSKP